MVDSLPIASAPAPQAATVPSTRSIAPGEDEVGGEFSHVLREARDSVARDQHAGLVQHTTLEGSGVRDTPVAGATSTKTAVPDSATPATQQSDLQPPPPAVVLFPTVPQPCSKLIPTASPSQIDADAPLSSDPGVAADATATAISADPLGPSQDGAAGFDDSSPNAAIDNVPPLLAGGHTPHVEQAPKSSTAPAFKPDRAFAAANTSVKKRAVSTADSVSAQPQQGFSGPPVSADIQVQVSASVAAAPMPVAAPPMAAFAGTQPAQASDVAEPMLPVTAKAVQTLHAPGLASPAMVSGPPTSVEGSPSLVASQRVPPEQVASQQILLQQVSIRQRPIQPLGTQLSQKPQTQPNQSESASPALIEQPSGTIVAATLPSIAQQSPSGPRASTAPAVSTPVPLQTGAHSTAAPSTGPTFPPAAAASRRSARASEVQTSQSAAATSVAEPERSTAIVAPSPASPFTPAATTAATFPLSHGPAHVPASAVESHATTATATTVTQLGQAGISVDTLQTATPATRASALEVGFHDATLGWLSVRASTDVAGDLHAAVGGRTQAASAAVDTMLPALGRYLQNQNVAVHSVSAATAGAVTAPSAAGSSAAFAQDSSRGNTSASTTADGGNTGTGQRQGSGERSPRQHPAQTAWLPEQSFASSAHAQRAERLSYAAPEQASMLSVRI